MTTTTKSKRQLLTSGEPEALYPVPELPAAADFVDAPDLKRIGWAIIAADRIRLPQIDAPGLPTRDVRLTFLWKAKGGASAGRATFGKAVKLSGLNRYFGDADIVIWLAADYCRGYATAWQIEALIFHELSHVVPVRDAKGNVTGYGIEGHDFEGFRAEIEHYGLYMPDAQHIAPAFQMALALEEPAGADQLIGRVVREAAQRINAGELGPGITAEARVRS